MKTSVENPKILLLVNREIDDKTKKKKNIDWKF